MKGTNHLKGLFEDKANNGHLEALTELGIHQKADVGSKANVNCMEFSIVRQAPFPGPWYGNDDSKSAATIQRTVQDYLTFNAYTWVTVRFWNKSK